MPALFKSIHYEDALVELDLEPGYLRLTAWSV